MTRRCNANEPNTLKPLSRDHGCQSQLSEQSHDFREKESSTALNEKFDI